MSLVNTKGQDGAEVLVRWQAGGPGFADLARMIADHEAPFEVIAVESGLELACHNRPDDVRNRARLRIHDYGDDKMAAFFFKTSGAPGSSQRFSYGGVAFKADKLRTERVSAWIDFVASGLNPAATPRGVHTSFQFTVPD